jgi:hypothetical protein
MDLHTPSAWTFWLSVALVVIAINCAVCAYPRSWVIRWLDRSPWLHRSSGGLHL